MFKLFKKTGAPVVPAFAECETVFATGTSPIHIRPVTPEVGLMKGGGADTAALCGVDVSWDTRGTSVDDVVASIPNQHDSFRYCSKCASALTGVPAEDVRAAVQVSGRR